MTAHLVARTLSHRSELPWVAEYRDPWRDRLSPDQPYLRHAEALERAVARDAATVVMPTQTWADHYGRLWDADVAMLTHGHDTELPQARAPEQPTLVHVGSYYHEVHDLTTLWRALARLRETDPASVPRVRFVGNLPAQLREQITRFGLDDMLDAPGYLPHDSAMRELMSASMLIASGIAGDHPARRGWVPAKLFEYLASDLPVLYLADPDSDASRLLAGQPGVHVVRPSDVDGAVTALRAGLNGRREMHREVGHLSRDARTEELARILDHARVSVTA